MPETPIRQHSRLKVALVLVLWFAILTVLIVLSPDDLKVVAPLLWGAPTFAYILRNYIHWPPQEPFQFGPSKWKRG